MDFPPQQFLTAKELASWLCMEVRTFREHVRAGIFPTGVLSSKRVLVWSRVDAAWCAYVMIHRNRFQVTNHDDNEDDQDEDDENDAPKPRRNEAKRSI